MDISHINARRSICLVANDYDGVIRNGGIGTYFHLLAQVLAHAGWQVHVLLACPVEDPEAAKSAPERLKKLGIHLHILEDLPNPFGEDGHTCRSPWFMERSDRIRHCLELLHAENDFDLIEFAEWQGLGFRSVQAKRSGSSFQDVGLIVRAHSCSQWVREGNLQWIGNCEDVRHDYCERYAFEHADFQASPSRYMLEYLRSVGWHVRPDAIAEFNPFPESHAVPSSPKKGDLEIVFFGRLEVRKGLEIFLDAITTLPPSIPITFLGKDTHLADGTTARETILNRTASRTGKVQLLTDLNREQAEAYICSGNRLSVIASLADNLPYTVVEALVNRVPFVASNVGGIPELIEPEDCKKSLLFEPNVKDLRRCLNDYLAMSPEQRARLHGKASDVHSVSENRVQVADLYERFRVESKKPQEKPAATQPLVSIAVPYYNLPQYLPATLLSLARQTYSNFEVIVVNDGSTDPKAIEVFEEMKRKYPRFRFLTHTNSGIGATRNRGLTEAKGEFFIPVDADNIAHPRMVERFVNAMAHRPDAAALTCYYKAFREDEDIVAGRFPYFYRPSGGPMVMGAITNVFGDANAIYRTEAFRSVGGYEIDRNTSWEDWESFVKLTKAGLVVDVVPEFLFFYRHRDESWMRVTSEWRNHRRVLRQFFDQGPINHAEGMGLWTMLVSMKRRVDQLENHCHYLYCRGNDLSNQLEATKHAAHHIRIQSEQDRASAGYRVANKLNNVMSKYPTIRSVARGMVRSLRSAVRVTRQTFHKLMNPMSILSPARH